MQVQLPVDLHDVEEQDFSLLDPGTYDFRIENVVQKTGKTSGKPYLNVELSCLDEDFEKRRVFDILSLSEKAMWRLKEFATSAGIDIATEFDTEDFVGEEVSVTIGIEEGKGDYKDRNNVTRYN